MRRRFRWSPKLPMPERLALCWRVSQYITAEALADAWDHLLAVGEG